MWKEKLLTLSQTSKLALLLAGIGLLLIIVGIGEAFISENKSHGVLIEEAASTSASALPSIIVDVSGAVEKPGVYKLSTDARVQEALIAAGGLSKNADRTFLAKSLNLAAKLSDGIKIYIPSIGENSAKVDTTRMSTSSQIQTGIVAGANTGLININSASNSELDSLPGIGPATAGKIIDNRPYESIDDLLAKKIVTKSVFEKIKTKVTVN